MDKPTRWALRNAKERKHYLNASQALYGDVSPPPDVPIRKKRSPPLEKPCDPEKVEQHRFVCWLDGLGVRSYSIPNGCNVSAQNRATLLYEGLSPGMPDLGVPIAKKGYHGAYIEFKRADGGRGLSPLQKDWLDYLTQQGYFAICCNGFEEAKGRMTWYLSDE